MRFADDSYYTAIVPDFATSTAMYGRSEVFGQTQNFLKFSSSVFCDWAGTIGDSEYLVVAF